MAIPNIEIKVGSKFPFDQLVALYDSVGWVAYTREPQRSKLQDAIRNTTYVVSAWAGTTLVGLARGLSDDVSIFYLQDILVRPDFQGRGIGRQLLNNCLQRFEHVRTKVVLTDDKPQQLAFYESLDYKNTGSMDKVRLNTFVQIKGMDLG